VGSDRRGEPANRFSPARANDGSGATPPVFVPQSTPGEYQLTPAELPAARLHALASGAPVCARDPEPIPPDRRRRRETVALTTDDFGEVKAPARSTAPRERRQTQVGRFWGAAPVQNVWNQDRADRGIAHHNTLIKTLAVRPARYESRRRRHHLYDSKYVYPPLRPVTAVRAADTDGNPTPRAMSTGRRCR